MVAQALCISSRQADRITLMAQRNNFNFFFFCIVANVHTDAKNKEIAEQKSGEKNVPEMRFWKLTCWSWSSYDKFTKDLCGIFVDQVVTRAPAVLWAQWDSLLGVCLCSDCSKEWSQKPAQAMGVGKHVLTWTSAAFPAVVCLLSKLILLFSPSTLKHSFLSHCSSWRSRELK